MYPLRGKRYLPAFLSAILAIGLWGVAFAAPQAKSLSLSESISTALDKSPQVTLAKIAVIDAEKALEKITADQLLPGYRRGVQSAKDDLLFANMALAAVNDEVSAKVEQAYFALIMADETIAMRTEGLSTAKKQLELGKAKLKAGIGTSLDVMSLDNNVVSSQYALENAKSNRYVALMKLNRALGWDLATPVKLTDPLSYKPVKVDIKSALEYALKNKREILQAQATVKRREEDVQYADNSFTPPAELDQAKRELEKAKIAYAQALDDAKIAVQEAYVTLLDAQNNVDVQNRNLVKAKASLELTTKRYKAGVAFSSDLINAQNSYQSAETQKLEAINNYRNCLSSFYRCIGKPNPALQQK